MLFPRRHGMRTLLWMALWVSLATPSVALSISTNDNTRPVGRLDGDVLTVRLFAGIGAWRPLGPGGQSIDVAAFGEEGGELSVPGPLIRVPEGTTVVVTLRNTLASALHVNGLCPRPGGCGMVSIAPGASQEIRFGLNAPGTYFYWAATAGTLATRQSRDTQLVGAIVVDPRDGAPPDRVFVISTFGESPPPLQPRSSESDIFAIFVISSPPTETLHHQV